MPLRLLRAYLPSNDPEVALALRSEDDVELVVTEDRGDFTQMEVIVPTDRAERVVKLLEQRYGSHEIFRILVFPLEATVPKSEADENSKPADSPPISVEELYQEVRDEVQLDWVYVMGIAIAALVAAAGMIRDSTELIVASMILAPLLGPSMAVATGTALGDLRLGLRGLGAIGLGIAISLAVAAATAGIFGLPLDTDAVNSRMSIGVLDFVIAATAGVSAALSYTSGAFGRIVGVMIAIALLPPLVLTGMLLGTGHFSAAVPPALVTAINFIGINLCGVAVLFARKVRPRSIFEREKARRAVYASIGVWSAALLLLVILVVLADVRGMT